MDYSRFFNRSALKMTSNTLRKLGEEAILNPKLISLASGIPDPQTFPFKEAEVKLKNGSKLHFSRADFRQALQYSTTNGFPELVKWLKEWQKLNHNPPTFEADDHPGRMECMVVNGSMDGLARAIQILAEEGDNFLIEQPAFPGPSVVLQNHLINMLGVTSDEDGLNPGHLRKVLSKWKPSDSEDSKSGIPKVLYCSPSAGNPTGTRLTMERKREIYNIAQEYNLIILEDDPYFFLQFSQPFVPSFLSIDVDGRVVRFDSFSKLISAGMRIGFLSGPSPIIEKIGCTQQASTFHASGLSQMFLLKYLEMLDKDGFMEILHENRRFYQEKRDQCLAAAKKHLTGLAEWTVPSGGIFMWIKLLNVTDSQVVAVKAVEKDVLFLPGKYLFLAYHDYQTPYIRIAYSIPTEQEMDIALSKIAEILREPYAE